MEVPADIWEVNERLQFDEPLGPDDDRWVDTAAGRGEFSFDRLYRMLGVDSNGWQLRGAPGKAYVLFCGHRGCGKSTELRRVHERLNKPDLFFSVLIDAASTLDPNNLQYQDVLLALAQQLLEQLPDDVKIDAVHLSQLQRWFDQRVVTLEAGREFAKEIAAGAEVEAGIPFLARMFAKMTTAFRTNTTYKDELRTVVRNHFSEFASAFSQLILAVEEACQRKQLAQRVLFLVDGTDRLSGGDAEGFFVRDVHQLQLIKALFVYTAPIHLVHAGVSTMNDYNGTFTLPMVKIEERDGSEHGAGVRAMRELLLKRAPNALFDSEETIDLLVRSSGGHPRDLLRLLQYSFEFTRSEVFDNQSAKNAVRELGKDYRTFLEPGDYELLNTVDTQPEAEHNSERVRYLLYNLALLEFNSFWWRSHPVVRKLDGYRRLSEE